MRAVAFTAGLSGAGVLPIPQDRVCRAEETTLTPALDGETDIALLHDSLALTPWERMKANDDALNFAESLRAAMTGRNAKPR
jgi:hypothetical protein